MKKLFLAAISLFVAQTLHSAALPNTVKQELVQDFSGGLNTNDPSHKIATNYSPFMRNVFIDNGKIERINGYIAVGSSMTLSRVTGIFPYVRETGQTTFLVTDSSITLETSDFKSWIFVSSGSNTASILTWMQVRNKMWGFNGLDFVITWDGVTKSILNGSLIGTTSTPNVPKFRYGAYYQDRVWGLGIPGGASDIYWSATITTDSIIIAPDNQFAWSDPRNATYAGRGDGQVGTALFVYQGLLRAGKEQSLYTIYGDNPSNYSPRKEEASVGIASQESVRVLDGDAHFINTNGVYRNTQRITDLIEPDINTFLTVQSGIVSNVWNTEADFKRGQFFGSTVTPDGFLTINTTAFFMNRSTATCDTCFDPNFKFQLTNAIGSSVFGIRIPTETVPNNFYGYPSLVTMAIGRAGSGCGGETATLIIKNRKTGNSVSETIDPGTAGSVRSFSFVPEHSLGSLFFNGDELANSSFTLSLVSTLPVNCTMDYFSSTFTGYGTIKLNASTTIQFISEVSTLPMVTAWGTFDSANNTNGGAIAYFIKTSTSSVNITTQPWQSVVPGIGINAPTINNYIQWASTISDVNAINPLSNIDNVIISHIEGQSSIQRPIAIDWNNRYWLSVSTQADISKREIYVKSRTSNTNPNAWMPIDGENICAFAKTPSVLYGGSCSTGIIYRLDYGTNFDGQPIISTYDFPDMALGDYFLEKNILKYIIDGSKSSGGTMSVFSSVNEATFTSSTFSITGVGRYTHIVEGVTHPVKTLRLRLQNGEKDIGLGIYNVNILYEPAASLSNK